MLSLHISSSLTVTRDWEEYVPCQIVHKGVTLHLFLLTHCSVHLLMLPSTNFHWSEIISYANVCCPCKQISDVPLNKYLFPCQQIFVALYRRTFFYQLSWSRASNQIAFQQVSSTTSPILLSATKQEFFFSRNLFGNQTVDFHIGSETNCHFLCICIKSVS